ncbi:methyltransferase-like protein 9 isoform X2 [Manduca sexta]|uniref:methyltransferase-like protein 9 isoform X2 n=1 Tax=Manduca sexta TaxID=7130 RepID=UPI0011825DA8|nr:methyltransferase-like protein 9 isoform X2 [Manduca sexta]
MRATFQIICCSALICHALAVEVHKCMKTDLFSYIKEDQPYCRRYESPELITNNWKPTLLQERYNKLKMASSSGSNGFYRPRSALARALYEKQSNDRLLQEFDQNEWYRVNQDRLSPELHKKFVQLHPDEETKVFLSNSIDKSSWVWTQIWYLLAKAVLKHFWSITDINGWLGRGSMFVLSEAQVRQLLQNSPRKPNDTRLGALVDVGAGDGEVSRRFANLYSINYATEISASMQKTLAKKGYTLLDTDDWWREQQFDCVCMMNLLDRCSKPVTMLKQAHSAIAPGGVLVIALVLPYKPYVEADHKPEERLPISGMTFEEQVTSFVKFMRSLGFELSSWARAPYLCEGDFAQAYYWLDDSVYVFEPAAAAPDT